jgi:hypothetical protein
MIYMAHYAQYLTLPSKKQDVTFRNLLITNMTKSCIDREDFQYVEEQAEERARLGSKRSSQRSIDTHEKNKREFDPRLVLNHHCYKFNNVTSTKLSGLITYCKSDDI